MASSGVPQPLPIFDGENYDFWSIKMKTLFLSLDLWDLIEKGKSTEGNSAAVKKEQQNDAKALFYLQQAVSEAIFPRIMGATSSKQAWEILQKEFQGSSKVKTIKLQNLRREMENLKMRDSENAIQYSTRMIDLINQMRVYGETIEEERIVQKFLITLTEKYDHVVAAIEESKDLSTLTLTELMGSLQAHEQRMNRKSDETFERALQSKINLKSSDQRNKGKNHEETSMWSKKNYPPCSICKRTNHLEKDCFHKGKPQCSNCKKFGHLERYCRFKDQEQHQAHVVEEIEETLL
ncbi:hypothetical protein CASFOL_011380 [Castilleja foliolosa]|uniref:CCHC-type domain-containing protein n=1 Tax=Castilleja foliolosa TaxID=1961234 RepID=A0ABD3DVB3_9LAMI